MNKKNKFIYILILVSLILVVTSGCNYTEHIYGDDFCKISTEDDEPLLMSVGAASDSIEIVMESRETIIESGPNFRVVRINEGDINNVPKFRYEVFNNRGETIRVGTGWRVPSFYHISDDVLEISIGAGTGMRIVQFYSPENDLISEVFTNPILITHELIGLLKWDDANSLALFVRNIFDKEIYYKEFTLENFAAVANPMDAVVRVEYLGDSTLEIIYLSGEDLDKKVVAFEL